MVAWMNLDGTQSMRPALYNDVALPEVSRVQDYAHVNAVAGYLRGFVAGARSAIAAFDVGRSLTTSRGDRQP